MTQVAHSVSSTGKADIDAIIASFAKSNKYSKAKLETLVSQLKDSLTVTVSRSHGGLSKESAMVRDYLRTLKGEKFTSRDLADKLNVHQTVINNNLRYLAKHENIAHVVGEKRTGSRGKPSLVWEIR